MVSNCSREGGYGTMDEGDGDEDDYKLHRNSFSILNNVMEMSGRDASTSGSGPFSVLSPNFTVQVD